MAIVKFDPMRDLAIFRGDMNRLFENFFAPSRFPEDTGLFPSMWCPCVDVRETKESFVFVAELPGVTKDDVKISFQDNTLTLRGEKKGEKETKGENFHRMERQYGGFQRSFQLPCAVMADKIEAKFKDGILTITLPKAEEARPKEIPIKVS